MREVVKSNIRRKESSKRTRRRRRNMPVYVFFVFVLVLAIGVTLSVTLFFNINTIMVKGESDYQNEDIIRISGIEKGDNLVRLDAAEAENKILASMVYIEEADVKKKYPDKLEINVVKSQVAACISCDGGFLLVSKKGKILDKVSEADKSLIRIDGFEASDESLGSYLKSSDSQKDSIVIELLESVFSKEKQRIKSIDMSDKYEILINYEDRIVFEMGNSNDIKYKLNLADTVLNDMNDKSEGKMIMVGTNQISFRSNTNSAVTKKSTRIPVSDEDMPDEDLVIPRNNSQDDDSLEDSVDYNENNEDQQDYEDYVNEDNNEYQDEFYED